MKSARITIVERGPDVSFANCGLPYIGGEIPTRDALAVQTPESLKGLLNLDVRPKNVRPTDGIVGLRKSLLKH